MSFIEFIKILFGTGSEKKLLLKPLPYEKPIKLKLTHKERKNVLK